MLLTEVLVTTIILHVSTSDANEPSTVFTTIIFPSSARGCYASYPVTVMQLPEQHALKLLNLTSKSGLFGLTHSSCCFTVLTFNPQTRFSTSPRL